MLTAERGAAPVPAHFASVRDKLGSVPHLFQGLADSRGVFRELLAPELVHELGRRDPYLALLGGLDVAGQLEGRHPMLQGIYLWSKSLLPNYVLAAERLDMAHGIEVRQPFLDHQLFELVRRMPPSLLVRNDVEKFVLREAARPWLPDRTYRMPKQPFTAPPATLTLHNPLLTLLQDQLRSRSMAACPLVNHRAVRALLDALPRMSAGRRIALDSVLLMLGSAAILHDRFIHEKAT
jgi:asparagine synthase (glutamine-hydrolysing)